MEIINHNENGQAATEIKSPGYIISSVQDSLDLMGTMSYQGSHKLIIYEENIIPDFFNLKTGIAGEILQKFVNYGMQLAVIGAFNKYNSKSLNDFIRECNRGNQLFFVEDIEAAKVKLFNK